MKGIYIKGMKMPKSCGNCWALDDYGDYPRCRITEEQRGYTFPIREKRMDKCPFIKVLPNWDLISRSALIIDLMDRGIEGIQTDDWHEIQQAIMDAPTVIPAKEDKE